MMTGIFPKFLRKIETNKVFLSSTGNEFKENRNGLLRVLKISVLVKEL